MSTSPASRVRESSVTATTWQRELARDRVRRQLEEHPGVPAVPEPLLATGLRRWAPDLGITAISAACVASALVLLSRGNPRKIDGLGLLHAIPGGVAARLGIVLLGFLTLAWRRRPSPALLVLHLAGIVLVLDAAPLLIEGNARFPVAWVHAGFVDQIARHGAVLHSYDARMSWPAFFAGVAALTSVSGGSALTLLGWTPFVLHLLYLGPLVVIARALLQDVRARWVGLLLFLLGDWVGQAYFAPQGIAYLLLLTALALLLTVFRARTPDLLPVWRRLPEAVRARATHWDSLGTALEEASPAFGRVTQLGAFALLGVVTFALLPTHQLTPVALLVDAFALLVVGRLSLVLYPVLLTVLLACYVSFLTIDFWSGHRWTLLSGGSTTVTSNLTDRLGGSSDHATIIRLRLLVTGVLLVAAVLGVRRLAARRQLPLTIVALGFASLPLPLLQAYGGEALLRVVFYALPFLALLSACAVVTLDSRVRSFLATGALVALLAAVFPLTRYGNESFEAVSAQEIRAVQLVYASAPRGAAIACAFDDLPWKYRDLKTFDYRVIAPSHGRSPDLPLFLAHLRKVHGPVYVVLTRGQERWGSEVLGYPAHWMDPFRRALASDRNYRSLLSLQDAHVFVRRSA